MENKKEQGIPAHREIMEKYIAGGIPKAIASKRALRERKALRKGERAE